ELFALFTAKGYPKAKTIADGLKAETADAMLEKMFDKDGGVQSELLNSLATTQKWKDKWTDILTGIKGNYEPVEKKPDVTEVQSEAPIPNGEAIISTINAIVSQAKNAIASAISLQEPALYINGRKTTVSALNSAPERSFASSELLQILITYRTNNTLFVEPSTEAQSAYLAGLANVTNKDDKKLYLACAEFAGIAKEIKKNGKGTGKYEITDATLETTLKSLISQDAKNKEKLLANAKEEAGRISAGNIDDTLFKNADGNKVTLRNVISQIANDRAGNLKENFQSGKKEEIDKNAETLKNFLTACNMGSEEYQKINPEMIRHMLENKEFFEAIKSKYVELIELESSSERLKEAYKIVKASEAYKDAGLLEFEVSVSGTSAEENSEVEELPESVSVKAQVEETPAQAPIKAEEVKSSADLVGFVKNTLNLSISPELETKLSGLSRNENEFIQIATDLNTFTTDSNRILYLQTLK
ncbi:hypothetical protein COV61_00610, partial [Candidatus Micrarchaeota archaeon CG11_big_fil_rev_8_21_14_0_20_47_5]